MVLLALLGALSLGPWLGSLRAHDDLDGLARRLDEAGSLRYRMVDLGLQLEASDGGDPEKLRAALVDQQTITRRLITGAPKLPGCTEGQGCERLREHLDHVRRDLAPLVLRAAQEPAVREQALAAIRQELLELDETVHLLAQVGQERVNRLVVLGSLATAASLLLVTLVGYGMWEVFSRIRRLDKTAGQESSALPALISGPDEVAQLARTLSSTMRELRRYGEAERGRAEQLLDQRRAARTFADDLRDWLAEPGSLDSAFGRAARTLGFDAVWADEQAMGGPRLLGAVGLDPATWEEAVLPMQRRISGNEAAFAESGQSLDLSERMPQALRASGLRSLVLVPLTLGGERLGWMGMASSREPPAGETLAVGHLLAHGLTLAVVARRLVRERERHAQLAELLATLPELGQGAAAIDAEIRRFIDHEVGLLCRYGAGDVRDQTWRMEGGEAVLLAEACRLPLEEVGPAQVTRTCETLTGFDAAHWLLAVLRVGPRAVGAVALGRRKPFAAREVEALERAAPVLASALERMRLSEQLRRTEQDAALAGMGRMVAHEVRNPLNNLMLHAHRIERLVGRLPTSGDQGALTGHAAVLRGELARLSGIVGDFLGLGQPAAREDTDLRELVGEVCRLYAPALAEQRVRVDTELGDAPAMAAVDRPRIVAVLENLLKNAIEATKDESERHVCISVQPANGSWAISVRDTGPGVSSLERLFAPGYTTKPMGAGMGLAISRRIAEIHDGQLVARNAAGGGAEFVLTLRATGAKVAARRT